MNLQEKNSSIEKLVKDAERALSEVFATVEAQGKLWFILFDNSLLSLDIIKNFGAIVFVNATDIEHFIIAEDTDMFYLDDYETRESLIADIVERAKNS